MRSAGILRHGLLLGLIGIAWLAVGCSEDGMLGPAVPTTDVPDASNASVNGALALAAETGSALTPGLMLGPIDKLTVGWYSMANGTTLLIPLGAGVQLKALADPGAVVRWIGAQAVERDGDFSRAQFTASAAGMHDVRVAIEHDGALETYVCHLKAVKVDLAEIRVTAAAVVEQTARLAGGDTAGGSVQRLRSNYYRVPAGQAVELRASAEPVSMTGLIEWRIDGVARFLGGVSLVTLDGVGTYGVSVGPPDRAAQLTVDTYSIAAAEQPPAPRPQPHELPAN
jgi:hypothetical protein